MEVFLNRYGLVTIKLNDKLTMAGIGKKLKIDLDLDDRLMLDEALQADENRIGLYNGNLFLCVEDIFAFFVEQLDGLVIRLLTSFHQEKICAVYYYSIPDLFGYSYFENGRRIRTKYGIMDDIWVDIGDELPIEKENQSIGDICNWVVEQVTGEGIPILAGKKIEMIRFK